MELLILAGWFGLSIAVGSIASGKGRSGFAWFLLSLFLSPLIGGLFLLIAGEKKVPIASRKCPFCAEEIQVEAVKCKHCGSDIPPLPKVPQGPPPVTFP